jgi:hypothetical protein
MFSGKTLSQAGLLIYSAQQIQHSVMDRNFQTSYTEQFKKTILYQLVIGIKQLLSQNEEYLLPENND